jgi:hypothetical protein
MTFTLPRRYSRAAGQARWPARSRTSSISDSALAAHWRPLLDLTPAPESALWAGNIPYIAEELSASPAGTDERAFPAIIPVPGLRSQVAVHAGLSEYACEHPADLRPQFQTPGWRQFLDALTAWDTRDGRRSATVLSLLNILTFPAVVVSLAGEADGLDSEIEYELARAMLRLDEKSERGLALFQNLAAAGEDPVVRVNALSQVISAFVRYRRGDASAQVGLALSLVRDRAPGSGSWSGDLTMSRLLRAVALWASRAEGHGSASRYLGLARSYNAACAAAASSPAAVQLAREDDRILLDAELKLLVTAPGTEPARLIEQADRLCAADPWDPVGLLNAADAVVAAGELRRAAEMLSSAGLLGTMAGALAAWRSGLLWLQLSEPGRAAEAFRLCVDLDPNAIEPQHQLRLAAAHCPGGTGDR